MEDFRTSLFSDCSLMKTVTSTKKSWCAALPIRKRKIKSIASSNWIDCRLLLQQVQKAILHMPLTGQSPNVDQLNITEVQISIESRCKKKMLANPVEWKEPTEPPLWTIWTTGFTSRKSDLETKILFAKKAVHTNFRVDIREHAPFFSHLVPGPLRKLQFSFCKTSLLVFFFFSSPDTSAVTLCGGELWIILLVRLAHSADLRSRLRLVSSAPSVAWCYEKCLPVFDCFSFLFIFSRLSSGNSHTRPHSPTLYMYKAYFPIFALIVRLSVFSYLRTNCTCKRICLSSVLFRLF